MSTPAAENTPPPAPAGAAATPPADGGMDPTLKLLFETVEGERTSKDEPPARGRSLVQTISEAKDEEPAAGDKKDGDGKPKKDGDPAPAGEKKETPPPAPEKTIGGRRKAPKAKPAPAPTPAASPAPVVPPAKTEDPKKDLDGIELVDEEKEQLGLAEFAEAKDPVKYKGLLAKTVKYLKDHAKFLEEQRKSDPEVQFDASNSAYQAWLAKNRPPMSSADVREIQRAQITDQVRRDVTPEMEEMRDDIFRRESEPVVREAITQFNNVVFDHALPEGLAKLIKEKGLAEAQKTMGLEVKVSEAVLREAIPDLEEMLRLTTINPKTGRGVVKYDASKPQHQKIVNLINVVCDNFNKHGGKDRVRGGRQFLPRAQFYKLPADQQAGYWTFSPAEIAKYSSVFAKGEIARRIKVQREEFTRLGFKQEPVAPPPAPAKSSEAPPAPRGEPSSGGGGNLPKDDVEKYTDLMFGKS